MKKLMIFSIVILSILLISSCSTQTNDTDGIESKTAETNGEVETTTEDESALLYADVPIDDFDGYNFRVLNNQSNFAFTIFDTEELNGEVLNDAIVVTVDKQRKV